MKERSIKMGSATVSPERSSSEVAPAEKKVASAEMDETVPTKVLSSGMMTLKSEADLVSVTHPQEKTDKMSGEKWAGRLRSGKRPDEGF